MYDLVLAGGQVIDGTRRAPYKANICISGNRIAKITEDAVRGAHTLDVTGLAVTPGFIDIHTHSDAVPFSKLTLDSKISQGVTTEVNGNCGSSILPATGKNSAPAERYAMDPSAPPYFASVSDYAAAAKPTLINYACLVGHSALRLSVMGFENRHPTDDELQQLKALLAQQLQQGAFGLSLGLIYPPSAFSATEELVELAKVVAQYGGILSVHMRNEGPRVFEAVDEVLEIARRSGVHLQISHLKLQGAPQWGKAHLLLDKLRAARAEGIRVTCDQYPFCASSTGLKALVPNWAHDGGMEAMAERLKAKEGDIPEKILENIALRGGTDAIMIAKTTPNCLHYLGMTLTEICQELALDPVDAVIHILLESNCITQAMYFNMSEEDMLAIMSQDFISVGSDGSSVVLDSRKKDTLLHPRNYATFPRFFQTVRENRLMPVEDAVYKMTGLPAGILGLQDRGVLKEGNIADITVFDPAVFASPATFRVPAVRPVGLHHVIVGGKPALENGVLTGERNGIVLLK